MKSTWSILSSVLLNVIKYLNPRTQQVPHISLRCSILFLWEWQQLLLAHVCPISIYLSLKWVRCLQVGDCSYLHSVSRNGPLLVTQFWGMSPPFGNITSSLYDSLSPPITCCQNNLVQYYIQFRACHTSICFLHPPALHQLQVPVFCYSVYYKQSGRWKKSYTHLRKVEIMLVWELLYT